MKQKNRFTKFVKIAVIKPEFIAVAVIFFMACLYILGLSARNIITALSYDKENSSSPINSNESNHSYDRPVAEVRPQAAKPELLNENPVKKVLAIVDNYTQINESGQWYTVGDIVEGQAKIIAIEPTRILVEWNGMQSYVHLDYSSVVASGTQTSGRSDAVRQQLDTRLNNLTEEQRARLQQGLQGLQSMAQIWQNMTPDEIAERQAMSQQMRERFQNMSEQERQNALQQLGQQWQQWLQSNQQQLPDFSLE